METLHISFLIDALSHSTTAQYVPKMSAHLFHSGVICWVQKWQEEGGRMIAGACVWLLAWAQLEAFWLFNFHYVVVYQGFCDSEV